MTINKYKKALKELKRVSAKWIKNQNHGIYFRNGEWFPNYFDTYADDLVMPQVFSKKEAIEWMENQLSNLV